MASFTMNQPAPFSLPSFDDDTDSPEKQALQLIRSDDPDLKLQATKQIIRLVKYEVFKQELSGSIEPLISMLRVDSPESHCESAFLALHSFAFGSIEYSIKIVEAGALKPIISVLQSQSSLHESGTNLLDILSYLAINKPVIVSSGAIPLLVEILRHGSPQSKINAIRALFNLSKDSSNLNIILVTNPIPLIVNLLKTSEKSSLSNEKCIALIESLVCFDEGRMALTSEEGGMLAVVEVIKFGPPQSQRHAVQVLLTMCDSDRCKYRELIVQKGVIFGLSRYILLVKQVGNSHVEELLLLLKDVVHQTILQSNDLDLKLQVTIEIGQLIMNFRQELSSLIEPLVSMLQVDFPESHHTDVLGILNFPESHHMDILGILVSLADHNEENKIKIMQAGALEPIIRFLKSQSLWLQESATLSLCSLSTSAINKQDIGSSDAIPLLVNILGHGSQKAKMNAIKALLELSNDPNNLNIILETNPIPLIVNFLKTNEISSKTTEMCSALIESLVVFDKGRIALTSEEGGMLAVVTLFKSGSPKSQEHAVGVLLRMCQSDRRKYEELILGEDIIPGLEKLTDIGTLKSKLKAQMLLLLLRRVPRVTIEGLNDNNGRVHQGIHFVAIDYLKGSKEPGLSVTSEDDGRISLLHRISPDVVYEMREDTLISWRDPEYSAELSLRFQETKECSYIWNQISDMQNLHFNTLNTTLRRRQIAGSTGGSNNNHPNDTSIDVEYDNERHNRDGSYLKVFLDCSFAIINISLEILSTIFEQFSYVPKSKYPVVAMSLSMIALPFVVTELIYKGYTERVRWTEAGFRGFIKYLQVTCFNTLADIVGVGGAILQAIITTINFFFFDLHGDRPIKISGWPLFFAICLLCSKFFENTNRTRSSRYRP